MKKFGQFICGLMLAIMPMFSAQAETFYIENYDVVLDVSDSRTVKVQEAITANFYVPSHGIIREIPLHSSQIDKVAVSENFSASYRGGYFRIQIGDAEQKISGRKVYKITFEHKLFSHKNEFYYNLIGTEWGVPIEKARFYVKMPDKVDAEKVGISIGRYGTRGFENRAQYTVEGAKIWGQTLQPLAAHEGITLRVEVPEGYFINTASKAANSVWLGLLLCTLFSFLTWYQYGKDEHVTPVVTFNPPKEISPAEAELIMHEKITDKGLISLIVKLANDGYLKIKSEKQKFTLSDFKPYGGSDKTERKLLSLLRNQANDGIVTDDDLKSSSVFYQGWIGLRNQSVSKADKKRFYEASSMQPWRIFVMFMYIVGTVLLTLFTLFNYHLSFDNFMLFIPVFLLTAFCVGVMCSSDIIAKIVALFMAVSGVAPIVSEYMQEMTTDNLSQIVMGAVCILITMTCFAQMMKPNSRGNLFRGQLLGLKNFIRVAEKKRLEMMVEQNPQYFYKILPYAYVLGVSNVWIKQFEGIAVPPPAWAVDSGFRMNNFNNFARGFNAAVVPSVANGGISRTSSSGGGGFSGGGFGGGGGHSW